MSQPRVRSRRPRAHARRPAALLCATLVLSCAADDRDARGSAGGAGITQAEAGGFGDDGAADVGDDGSAPGSDGAADSGDAADDGPSGVFDVAGQSSGADTGGPVVNDDECQKIDFLFVIDNSGSMANEQAALVNSFPGFIAAIGATVNAQNYQLMVIDTDAASVGLCTELCGTFPTCFGTACNTIPEPTACDMTLGGGVIKDAKGVPCDVTGDARYLTEEQTDLADTFACMAKVGIGGQDIERPMEAMAAAVGAQAQAGSCNAGFLRDDAILVVTFITDEEDDGDSLGDPAAWKDALVQAKGGNEAAIVVLGLVGDSDVPGGGCGPLGLAEPSPRLRTFAESFGFGSWGSICSPDYAPFFDDAVAVIDSACEIFDPEG
jgi:hypothetical protein